LGGVEYLCIAGGGAGGDGVVIIRMATTDYSNAVSSHSGSPSTATTSSDTYITWTSSGNLVIG
jgi:hypothetical protein